LIKLDSNENPFGPSPRAIEAVCAVLDSTHTYPEDDCAALRHQLASDHNLKFEQVLATPGSTGMLSLLSQLLLGPGLNAVTSRRSFIVYGMVVKAARAELIEAPMRGDEFDLSAILRAIDRNTRLLFVANPNNPTGTMIEAAAVGEFLAQVPGHVVVVLDEAYYEFARDFARMRKLEYSNSTKYVRQQANVVVVRTFSKVHGLAGLRIGYGLGSAELLYSCARLQNTYSVASAAQAAALAALNDESHIQRTVLNNTNQAPILESGLSDLGYRVLPTSANFVYCDLREDASRFAERLRAEGVSVRPLGAWGAQNCIRVTIGTAQQNQDFLKAVRKVRGNAM
jgi:histidinol-phosphate aminotransferase